MDGPLEKWAVRGYTFDLLMCLCIKNNYCFTHRKHRKILASEFHLNHNIKLSRKYIRVFKISFMVLEIIPFKSVSIVWATTVLLTVLLKLSMEVLEIWTVKIGSKDLPLLLFLNKRVVRCKQADVIFKTIRIDVTVCPHDRPFSSLLTVHFYI